MIDSTGTIPIGLSAFDLDHTLISTNISFSFGRYLAQQGVFSQSRLVYCASLYLLHKLGLLSLHGLHEKCCAALFKGLPLSVIRGHVAEFLDGIWDSVICTPVLERLQSAKSSGQHIVLLSSSPDFLVEAASARLGVDEWAASNYLVDDSEQIQGIGYVLDGKAKAAWMTQKATSLGIDPLDMTAYSDSYLDLPFLDAAGTAFGVSPDRKLASVCRERNWEVID